MLVVRVELWPVGDESKKTLIGTAIIGNDGTGTHEVGNYHVLLGKKNESDPKRILGYQTARWKSGRVEGFLRNKLGIWDLIYRGLGVVLTGRAELIQPVFQKPQSGT